MYCTHCGKELQGETNFCVYCGGFNEQTYKKFFQNQPTTPDPIKEEKDKDQPESQEHQEVVLSSTKTKTTLLVLVLVIFFRILACHRFYAGKVLSAFIMIIIEIIPCFILYHRVSHLVKFTLNSLELPIFIKLIEPDLIIAGICIGIIIIWHVIDILLCILGIFTDSKGLKINK